MWETLKWKMRSATRLNPFVKEIEELTRETELLVRLRGCGSWLVSFLLAWVCCARRGCVVQGVGVLYRAWVCSEVSGYVVEGVGMLYRAWVCCAGRECVL